MLRNLLRAPVLLMALLLLLTACGGTSGSALDAAPPDAPDAAPADVPPPVDVPADVADVMPDVPPPPPDVPTDVPPEVCTGEGCPGDAPDAGAETSDVALDVAAPDVPPPCPFECCDDTACDDRNSCTVDRCTDDVCTHTFDLCDDDSECTLDSCDPTVGCVHQAIEGCCPLTWVWREGFEADELPVAVIDLARNTRPEVNPIDQPVVWSLSSARAHGGARSLYAGLTASRTYDNGKWVATTAATPPIALSADRPSTLSFWAYLDVEEGFAVDTLNVSVEVGGTTVPIWAKPERVALRDWRRFFIDLAAFRGQEVRLVFAFDSFDGSYNQFEGVYVDDLAVGEACQAVTCTGDEQCNDRIACTTDTCTDGACTYTLAPTCCLNGADCRDGVACTIDLCYQSTCTWVPDPEPGCCDVDAECDDEDPCTSDACEDHACKHLPSGATGCCAADADCETGDPCTAGTCSPEGACVLDALCCETAADCSDGDDVCTVETCLTTGGCHVAPSGAAGCCAEDVLVLTFDEGAAGPFAYQNSAASVGWTIGGGAGTQSQTRALYYGNPATRTYQSGGANHGLARSGAIRLPKSVEVRLAFRMFIDVEAGAQHDMLTVSMSVGDVELTLWEKTAQTPLRTWIPFEVDLSGFGGESVELRFYFDTEDGEGNTGEGVYVDDLAVTSTCDLRRCANDTHCADTFGATTERCSPIGTCQYELVEQFCETAGQCEDRDVCTTDRCESGGCVFVPIPDCCHDVSECDDEHLCTTDRCVSGSPPRCQHTYAAGCCMTAEDCDDRNRCTDDGCPGPGEDCTHTPIEGCCLSSLDCDDGDACTVDRCTEAACTHTNVCCATDEECSDGESVCTVDTCASGQCLHTPTGAEGCCNPDVFAADFDGADLLDFAFDNQTGQPGWSLVSSGPPPGTATGVAAPFLYYGNPVTFGDYGTDQNEGTATSDLVDLPPNVRLSLTFRAWMNFESSFEDFEVYVVVNGRATLLHQDDSPSRTWEQVTLDLSPMAGQPVRIQFRFTTDSVWFEGIDPPQWQGVFVDAVRITSTCAPKPCTTASQCGQQDCVLAQCVQGGCAYDVLEQCCHSTTECNDNNACTSDACTNQVCSHAVLDRAGCCETVDDCRDTDSCTEELCARNQCVVTFTEGCHPPVPYCQGFSGDAPLATLGFEAWNEARPESTTTWALRSGTAGLTGPYVAFFGSPRRDGFRECVATPAIDTTDLPGRGTLRFRQYFSSLTTLAGDVVLQVMASPDDGATWEELWRHAEPDGDIAASELLVDLPERLASAPTLRVALCTSGANSATISQWAVDDWCMLPGVPPTFTALPDTTMNVQDTLVVPVAATDPDPGALTLRLVSGPAFVSLLDAGDGTGTLTITPDATDKGEYELVLAADDGEFETETTLDLTVVVPGEILLLEETFDDADGFATIGFEERRAADQGPAAPADLAVGETNWQVYATTTPFASKVAAFRRTPTTTDFDHWLVSPTFDATRAAVVTVGWRDAFDWGAGAPLRLSVMASRDGGATWSEVWGYEADVARDYGATAHTIDASAALALAAEGRIAFRVRGEDSTDINWWYVDAIEVLGIDAGAAPVWEPVPELSAPTGSASAFPLAATDADGDPLTFAPAEGAPAFVRVEPEGPQSAVLVVEPGIGDDGVYDVPLAVSDRYNRVVQTVALTVFVPGAPPVVAPVAPVRVRVNEVWKLALSAVDPDGDPLRYRPGSALPSFATLQDHGDGTATLRLAPRIADLGHHAFAVELEDTTQRLPIPLDVEVVVPGGETVFATDFEGLASLAEGGWRVESDPDSTANDWTLANDGDAHARFGDFPVVTDFRDRLVSPPLDTRRFASVTVGFWAEIASYTPADATPPVTFAFLASSDGGESWQVLWTHSEAEGDLPLGYVEVDGGAALATIPDLFLAFEVSGGDSSTILSFDIDDVTVGATP